MGLTSQFRDGNGKKQQITCVPAMRVGNGNCQKVFPLFGKGTAITKKLSRSSVQKQQTPKSLMGMGIQDVPVGKYTGT